MALRLFIALSLSLAALPAGAETYKWIDAKGQVNYSNAPPPSALKQIQVVEDRISVIGEDPSTREAVARMEARLAERRQYEAQEWLQRQRGLAMQAAYPSYGSDYGDYTPTSYYGGYYGGYARRPYLNQPGSVLPPRVMHHTHHTPRAAFRGGGGARR